LDRKRKDCLKRLRFSRHSLDETISISE